MKKLTLMLTSLILCLALSGAVHAQDGGGSSGNFGLLFRIFGSTYNDGVDAGAGFKYKLDDSLHLRFIAGFTYTDASPTSFTSYNLGAGLEYHLGTGNISPYVGGFLGIDSILNSNMDLYIGGMFGVEIKLVDGLAAFGEITLSINNILNGNLTINLGPGNGGSLGLTAYF